MKGNEFEGRETGGAIKRWNRGKGGREITGLNAMNGCRETRCVCVCVFICLLPCYNLVIIVDYMNLKKEQ